MNKILKSATALRRARLNPAQAITNGLENGNDHPLARSGLHRTMLALSCGAMLFGASQLNHLQAVVYGTADGDAHPHVGLAVFFDADGNRLFRGSGTLLSPTVFLTAGHCTEGRPGGPVPALARVFFSADMFDEEGYPLDGGIEGTPIRNPDFQGLGSVGTGTVLPTLADVGLVILHQPVEKDVYGQLPELGMLDGLMASGTKVLVDVVGYGLQDVRPAVKAEPVRYSATPRVLEDKSATVGQIYIKTSADPGKPHGSGTTCFGDSGGPIFVQNSNIILGVTSWGTDGSCASPGYGYRIDIAESLDFVKAHLEQE